MHKGFTPLESPAIHSGVEYEILVVCCSEGVNPARQRDKFERGLKPRSNFLTEFTLLELLIVIGIIAILAGAMVPIFRYSKLQTEINKAQQDVEVIRDAALRFNMDTGQWPPEGYDGDLTCLITNTNPDCPTEAEGWNGPYLSEWQNDPWRWYSPEGESFPQPYEIAVILRPCPPDMICVPVFESWV